MRLTYRDETGRALLTHYGKQMYCSTQATADCFAKLEDRVAAYEDAEEQGLLVRLPCKVGDTVYKLWYAPCHNGETYPDGMGCDGCFDQCDIHKEITEFTVPNVNFIWVNFVMKGNTTYYPTREEAEAALKGEKTDG